MRWQPQRTIGAFFTVNFGAPIGRKIVKQFPHLSFNQRTLFFHHKHGIKPLRKGSNTFRLQRPYQPDFIKRETDFTRPCLIDPQHIKRLAHIEIGFAGSNNSDFALRPRHFNAINPVRTRKSVYCPELMQVQPPFLLLRRVRPTDMQATLRRIKIWHHKLPGIGRNRHRGGRIHRLRHQLHRRPTARKARQRNAEQSEGNNLADARGVENGDHRIDHPEFALMRSCR